MKYIKTFEQFINESYNITNENKIQLSNEQLHEKAVKYLGILNLIKSIKTNGELSSEEKSKIEEKIEKAQDKIYNAEDDMNDGMMSENKATKIINYYESCIDIWKELIKSKDEPSEKIKKMVEENVKLYAIKIGHSK
jgi:hypothetical protein